MPIPLTEMSSQKFKFWSFISMVLLVFVHGYNLHIRFLQPWTIPGEPLTFTTFTEYFLANGIFRFRIPMLFVISGFLYALHDHQPYKQRIQKRFRTLMLPYLLWSVAGLLLTYILELFPFSRDIVASTNLTRIDAERLFLHDHRWYELLGQWIFFPLAFQLWFIRVLFVYNLAYPALRCCVTHARGRAFFFPTVLLMWLSTMEFYFFEGEGLLFFSLGIWLQKNNFNIDIPPRYLNPILWGFAFITLGLVKTWLAFTGTSMMGNAVYPLLIILHKLIIISGLICAWYGSDRVVNWCMKRIWFVWLSPFSFIIYAVHAPVIVFAVEWSARAFHYFPLYRFLTFIFLPAAVIVVSIVFGALLRKTAPRIYGLLTGDRGLS
ncbi:MAG: acyltransferase [Bacteroidetes bacterium]|nr:acyltransferase [Bacteroidota bacterium]